MSQEQKIYYFSSVGKTDVEVQGEEKVSVVDALPIGVKFPLQIGYSMGNLLVMHKDLKSQITDNFVNMIKTNWGERLTHYDFGGNLSPLIFELGTENVDTEAIARIQKTTSKYMPYVNLITFEASGEKINDGGASSTTIKIVYSIEGITSEMIEEVIEIVGE